MGTGRKEFVRESKPDGDGEEVRLSFVSLEARLGWAGEECQCNGYIVTSWI